MMSNFILAMEPAKLAAIIFAAVFGVICIICLVIALANKSGKEPYDKDGFVHKVLQYDFSIFNQLMNISQLLLFAGAVVVYFVDFKNHYLISAILLGVLLLSGLMMLYARFKVKCCRIEYNRNGLYQYGFFRSSKEIPWKELKDVSARGVGRDRIFTFVGKKDTKIDVPFKLVGAYEFIVFCEKQLDGKKFEVIKIGKARQ